MAYKLFPCFVDSLWIVMSHFIFEMQIHKLLTCQIQFNIDFYLSN